MKHEVRHGVLYQHTQRLISSDLAAWLSFFFPIYIKHTLHHNVISFSMIINKFSLNFIPNDHKGYARLMGVVTNGTNV